MVLEVEFWPRWEFNYSMAIILTSIYVRWLQLDRTWIWIWIDLHVECVVKTYLQCVSVWILIDSLLMHVDIMYVFMLFYAMKWLYLSLECYWYDGFVWSLKRLDVVPQNAENGFFYRWNQYEGDFHNFRFGCPIDMEFVPLKSWLNVLSKKIIFDTNISHPNTSVPRLASPYKRILHDYSPEGSSVP